MLPLRDILNNVGGCCWKESHNLSTALTHSLWNKDIFAEPGENNVGVTDIALESGSNDNTTTLEEDRKQVFTLANSGFFKNIIPNFF